jgi:hypothetical protein
MMRFSRKIGPFVFGVSVGLIIGVAIFVFKINDLFLKLKETTGEKVTIIERPVQNVEVKENKKEKSERFRIKTGKPVKTNYREVDSLIRLEEKEFNIAREELLTVKHVKAIRLDDNLSANDTMAEKLVNVDESQADLFFVEFWKTPLNSKGYRFTRNKLMLYGIGDHNVLIYQLDNAHYLKVADQVYRLFHGGEFRQLEKVVDEALLARLN